MDLLKNNSERILAIDFGIKRVGFAISDPLKLFSIPLKTLENNNKLFDNIDKIFQEYNIVTIISGYPTNADGSKSEVTKLVENFAKKIELKYKKEVIFIDERYSSKIAWEQIIEGVPSKKKRRNKELIDMKAAAVILDDYLKTLV